MRGYYAFADFFSAGAPWWSFAPASGEWVAGQVALWGEVVEYEDGARGEYAYPLTFALYKPAGEDRLWTTEYLDASEREMLEDLASCYSLPAWKVSVTDLDSFSELCVEEHLEACC